MAVTLGDPATRPGATDPEGPKWWLRPDDTTRPLLRGYLATVPMKGGVYHGTKFFIAVAPLLREGAQAKVFGRVLHGLDVLERLDQDDACDGIQILQKRNHAYDPLAARMDK